MNIQTLRIALTHFYKGDTLIIYRIGHILLLGGIGLATTGFLFLLTHLFAFVWLNPLIKIALCFAGAYFFLAMGIFFKKYHFFSQLLNGIACFFHLLGLYALFAFYPSFSPHAALIIVGSCIAALYACAWYWNLRIFACISTATGLLIPLLFYYQTGMWAHHALIIGYITFFTLGTICVTTIRYFAHKKWWPELIVINLIGLLFYFTLYLTNHQIFGLSLFGILLVGSLILGWLEHKNKIFRWGTFGLLQPLLLVGGIIPAYWINTGSLAHLSPYNLIILFIYSVVVYGLGLITYHAPLRWTSYGIVMGSIPLLIGKIYYNHLIHPIWAIALHSVYFSYVCSITLILFLNHYCKERIPSKEHGLVHEYGMACLAFTLYSWGYITLILLFDRLAQPKPSFLASFFEYNQKNDILIRSELTEALLSIYSALFAIAVIAVAFTKQWHVGQLLGLAFMLIAYYKEISLLIGYPMSHLKIITSFILGGASVLGGWLYKKEADKRNR